MSTKVLLLTQYPPHIGGVSTHSYNITKNSEETDFHVLSYRKQGKDIDLPENVDINYLPTLNFIGGRGLSYIFLAIKKGSKLVKKENIDIIHSQYAGPPCLAGNIIKRKTNTPLITTIHGSDQSWIKFRPVQKALENSDTIITVSNFLKKLIKNKINNTKTVKIFNGVSEEFKEETSEKERKYITYVGELSSTKGVETLIEVSKKLNEEFLIIGDGNLRKKLEKKSNKNVTFTGYQNKKEISKYLNKSKILILPSKKEGFGLTLIEAMKCGTPVIGRNIQGIKEIIQNNKNGLIFKDQKTLQKQIKKLQKNQKLWKKLSINGKKHSQKLKWEKTANKTTKIYKNLKNNKTK